MTNVVITDTQIFEAVANRKIGADQASAFIMHSQTLPITKRRPSWLSQRMYVVGMFVLLFALSLVGIRPNNNA